MIKYYYKVKYKLERVYCLFFVLIFWQPFIWKLIKPRNGTIDANSNWFLRYCVCSLNKARRGVDTFYMFKILGVMVRDPYSYPMKTHFKFSRNHLFVTRR